MKPLVILYATREGQTRRIAEHIEALIRERGHTAKLRDVRDLHEPFGSERYDGAILAASVHGGRHEPEMVAFVKRHRDTLEELPSAFLSVSLSEAGAEDPTRPDDVRAKAAADAQQMIDRFLGETGWRPRRVKAVAGALLYSKYNFIVRFVMKHIAKKTTTATDTSRDYEFTDWKALDRFVDEVLSEAITHTAAAAQDAPAPA
jgi:menaquinone-dependent protoporphyrinogen oxidase